MIDAGNGGSDREVARGARWYRVRVRAAFVAAVILLGGCAAVGPNFEPPKAPQQPEWQEVGEPGLTAEAVGYRDWWSVFGDPELDRLIELAYDGNQTLQVAGLRVIEARAQLGIAVGNLYPQQQQALGSYAYQAISENAVPVNNLPPVVANGVDTTFNNWALGGGASWELDFWGKFRRNIEAANANFVSNLADYDNAIVLLTGDVASTYALIRTFEARLEIARRNVELQKRSLNITEVRFRNGATTELDVRQAESLLYETEALIPQFENGLAQSRNALATLLGMPPAELDTVLKGTPGEIPRPPATVAVGVPADLLRRRPDIRSAELQAAAQSALIGVAKADLYPSLGLVGNIGLQASDAADLFKGGSLVGVISPGFKWNILNYGRITNNVRVQDAQFQQLVSNYQNTVLQAYQEVENAMVGFLYSGQEATTLEKSVKAAERSVEIALIQYRDGVADYTRVLNTQTFLVRVQDQMIAARGNVATNLIGMYTALGGGWQVREGKPVVPESTMKAMSERTDWGSLLPEDVPTEPLDPPKPAGQQSVFESPSW
ncbi:MAG: efflux transporter outer membrane subunit [Gammaproteobacteria bacterium]|nr:efflux transporter outer membrane subunit [Gammaproteobacteria bacterium]